MRSHDLRHSSPDDLLSRIRGVRDRAVSTAKEEALTIERYKGEKDRCASHGARTECISIVPRSRFRISKALVDKIGGRFNYCSLSVDRTKELVFIKLLSDGNIGYCQRLCEDNGGAKYVASKGFFEWADITRYGLGKFAAKYDEKRCAIVVDLKRPLGAVAKQGEALE